MRILFSGSSSFTGYWFIRSLVANGHEVVATFRRSEDGYSGMRAKRVEGIKILCQTLFECPIPSDTFRALFAHETNWDLWCHHAADVTDYRSPNFDALKAVSNNCRDLRPTLLKLRDRGCTKVLLTGSVFEQREGMGDEHRGAFSPYGLSKGLTADYFTFYVNQVGLRLGKFVIPNPFGPFEEDRFTTYLARSWLCGKKAQVSTPDYVRDNIHVSLLAKAYAQFAEALPTTSGFSACHPSQYAETQGDFTKRFAMEMGKRLQIPCPFEFSTQTTFPEPRTRVNKDRLDLQQLGWDESAAWDELANFYTAHYAPSVSGAL